ncbi:Exportin-1/Importin-beta-like [Sesbania bispinosa]|nr:Exportin-1/Importin-beta-like [Sesbania bispinosa]
MDNLDKAILIMFDESGAVNDAFKKQANNYCHNVKEIPSICTICIEKLFSSNIVHVHFWCLQTLHEAIVSRYSSMTPEERHMIRSSVFSIVCLERLDEKNPSKVLEGPAYIKNKLAQLLVTFIYLEYPLIWSTVFVDFFPHLSKGSVVIDMFCRVLNVLDDDLISLDYPRTPQDLVVAGSVKDKMREQCVPQIVRAWYDIVSVYRNMDEGLCAGVLDSVRRYISWIDIGLIVNDAFGPLLFDLVLAAGVCPQLRGAAVRCLFAIVSKGMEPHAKLTLLQSLKVSRVFRLVAEDGNAEITSDLGLLLSQYAVEALDCFKRIDSMDAREISMELLNEVLPSVLYVMKNSEVDATSNIVQFLSSYVATLKSFTPLREKQLIHMGQVLEVILVPISYDPMYCTNLDVLDKIGKEEEDGMAELRKDLFVLLRSVGRVAPDVTQSFIRNSLVRVVSSSLENNVEEVEASLSLLYALGESLSDEATRTGSALLSEMLLMLDNTQYVTMAIAAFLDERGIHHPNINVRCRANYLFMRVVKMLKAKLVPFIEIILQSLQDIVARFTSMNYTTKLTGSEDGNHIFEAIGLLIGMEDVPLEKQYNYLSSLLSPLCEQVKALLINDKLLTPWETNDKIVVFQHIIMAINSLSKGFGERLATASRPAIGLMFKQTLDVLLQVLIVFPKVEPLRSKVASFIHRMVDTLGASIFPYLPKALGQLLAESEVHIISDFLVISISISALLFLFIHWRMITEMLMLWR